MCGELKFALVAHAHPAEWFPNAYKMYERWNKKSWNPGLEPVISGPFISGGVAVVYQENSPRGGGVRK